MASVFFAGVAAGVSPATRFVRAADTAAATAQAIIEHEHEHEHEWGIAGGRFMAMLAL